MIRERGNISTIRWWLVVVMMLGLSFAFASIEPVLLDGNTTGNHIDISERVEIYVDSTGDLSYSEIPDGDYLPSKEAFLLINPKKIQKYNFYFRGVLVNSSTDTLNMMLQVPLAEMVTLHYEGKTRYGGSLSKPDLRNNRFMTKSFLVYLKPNEALTFHGKLKYAHSRKTGFEKKFYLQREEFAKYEFFDSEYFDIDYKYALFSTGFLFSVCFVFVFMVLHYVQTKDKLYLNYSIYLLTVILYSVVDFEWATNINIHFPALFNKLWFLKNPLGIIINGTYFYFISEFLDLKSTMPKINRLFTRLVYGLYVYVVVGIVLGPVLGEFYLEKQSYYIIRFLWFLPSVYFLIVIWRKQIRYGRIVLLGTIALLMGALISLVMSITITSVESFWQSPIIYTQFAILIEIAFFSLGVGKKMRDHEKERLYAKENLIQQLQRNSSLQTKINEQLQEKVNWQESLSEKQILELEKEKAVSQSNELARQLAQMELLALRSQMNPHFIFNSLNSIKSYILRNGALEASEYLTKFSNLIRAILQNSKRSEISLKDEIDTLLLYVKLEQMRFPEKFQFTFFHKSQSMLDSVMVPPLILQPYVENAIWHGLLHLDTKGLLKIEVVEKGDGCLVVIIEDNGIGRKRAEKLKSNSVRNYKSLGMGITKSRIELHNQINAKGIKVEVTDVFSDRESTGTRVQITVKCPLKEKKENDESNIN